MRIGLVQLSVGPDPDANLPTTIDYIQRCAHEGAAIVFTPEVTNLIETDGALQKKKLKPAEEDLTLAALRALARELSIWVQVGSLALNESLPDGRYSNTSFLIAPDGSIGARYDKIHMFDVVLSETEAFKESARYAPGARAVVAKAGDASVGLSVCYDLRFAHLYRVLAKSGADILSIPAAFAHTTGQAHWHVLTRARAIETGSFVVAAAQTGEHSRESHALRRTYGHSIVVGPWGEVLLDMGDQPGHAVLDIDLSQVETARRRVPAISSDRDFELP